MQNKIIGLVGPSGVGKNYIKQAIKKKYPKLIELTVFTTRQKRDSDGNDRVAGISVDAFLNGVANEFIVAAHQPFGAMGDWYGFSKKQIDDCFLSENDILTEIHIDNVSFFKESYKERIFLIGLVADSDYLDHNIKLRGSETESDKSKRLEAAKNENKKIIEFKEKLLVDNLVKVDWENREHIAEMVIAKVDEFFEYIDRNEENHIKFK